MKTLYWAYGLNTSKREMSHRCPAAVPAGIMTLNDTKLVFRSVADVVKSVGDSTIGALWWITQQCEDALDQLEGYPFLYIKEYGVTEIDDEVVEFMFYSMSTKDYVSPPHIEYVTKIREGYEYFGVPTSQLDIAIEESLHASMPTNGIA